MRFVDRVRIRVKAGDGGDGMVAWRREAHVVMGGPAGGDGGHGGSVVLVADASLTTLLDLRFRQCHRAEAGRAGQSKEMHGRGGADLELRVPVGTAVYFEGLPDDEGRPPWASHDDDEEGPKGGLHEIWVEVEDEDASAGEDASGEGPVVAKGRRIHGAQGYSGRARKRERVRPVTVRSPGELIGDLTEEGQRLVIAEGGRGGRGNIHFKSSTNRAPDRAEPGRPGEELFVRLELKLLADIGIVGFPNVGKSTLIRAISRARPEVADYPFTTLVPQLGVVQLGPERTMVVADVPGLVRGASEGRGLGLQFLRHLERTRVLLHLLAPDPGDDREPLADLEALEAELSAYGDMFAGRPRVVALNKIDTPEGEALVERTRRALRKREIPLFTISAARGDGLDRLLEALWRRLVMVRAQEQGAPSGAGPR